MEDRPSEPGRWTEEQTDVHGEHVDFDPIFAWPKPVQRPHPPIYLGGESVAALRRLRPTAGRGCPRRPHPARGSGGFGIGWSSRGAGRSRSRCFPASSDEAELTGYAEAGVGEITLALEPLPEADTMRALDALAKV